jgi:gliding motility-associated protein GldC
MTNFANIHNKRKMEDEIVSKQSSIKVQIGLNANNLPLEMHWTADDGGITNAPAKAMMLSLWNPEDNNTMKIDLWTKDMSVEEMKQFFHQTLLTMADTFEKATGENLIAEDLRDYCFHFAEKMDIMPEK